jgi:glutamyl-tRNA synthetase
MNGEYVRNGLSEDQLIEKVSAFVPQAWLEDKDYFKKVLNLDRERIKRLDEAKYIMEIFFEAPKVDMELLTKKDGLATIKPWFGRVIDELGSLTFSHDEVEKALRKIADSLEVQSGRLFYALRVGLTGRTEAPGLFDIFVTLGKQESIRRLENIQ